MKQNFRPASKQVVAAIDIMFACTLAVGLVLIYIYGAATLSHSAVSDHRAVIINMTDKTKVVNSFYKPKKQDQSLKANGRF